MSKYGDSRIDNFLAYLIYERHLKERTAIEYARDVAEFARFLEPDSRGPFSKVNEADADDIRRFFVSRKLNTPQRKKASLVSYYKYLQHLGDRSDNPATEITLQKAKKEAITVLRREEVKKLLNAPHGREAVRNKAILHFFYSGPKRKEVAEVLAADFDIGKQQIVVNGRVVPLKKDAADAIAAYMRDRSESDLKWLFVTDRELPVTEKQAWVILTESAREIGLPAKTAFERLRKSYTVHALEDNENILDVLNARGNDSPSAIFEEMKIAYGHSKAGPNLVGDGISNDTFDALDMGKIKEAWHEITALLGTKPRGALRETLVLLDLVSEKVLAEYGVEFSKTDNSGWKAKRALSLVLPGADAENEFFKSFAKNVAGIVDSIGKYRDLRSDAHASESERTVERYEAEYAVNLARATVAFIVQCYRVKKAESAGTSIAESRPRRRARVPFTALQLAALRSIVAKASRLAPADIRKNLNRLQRDLGKVRSTGKQRILVSLSAQEAGELHPFTLRASASSRKAKAALEQVRTKLARIAKPTASQAGPT